ncbi:MAG: WD40/YVTN/BNR-like repeat-containing protein [Candidatus Omnitrophota bacterium]
MKKPSQKTLLLVLSSLFLTSPVYGLWEKPNQPPVLSRLASATADPAEASRLLAASGNAIYENSAQQGWDLRWKLPGSGHEIEKIQMHGESPRTLFVLTHRGLWTCDRILDVCSPSFEQASRDLDVAWALAVIPGDPDHWILGTAEGLMESDDGGRTWFRFSNFPERKPFSVLYALPDALYAASEDRLYRTQDLEHFETVLQDLPAQTDLTDEGFSEDLFAEEAEPSSRACFHALASSVELPRHLWVGGTHGVFESRDNGKNWRLLPGSGMREAEVFHLAYAPQHQILFAATARAIYAWDTVTERWREIFEGLTDTHAQALFVASREGSEALFAVTRDGLMHFDLSSEETAGRSLWLPSPETLALFHRYLSLEPTVRDIQKAVVRSANVGDWKIRRWHFESRLSSLLPDLSFGKDFSRSVSIDLDRGGTSDADRYITGPDDIDKGWDFDISWDLGDLLWSSNQTSIDSREKLMVELRHDLLSEATRLYFERRRLQHEWMRISPAAADARAESRLRIDELTAMLDAMTGGYLGKRLEKLYRQWPEMEELWI